MHKTRNLINNEATIWRAFLAKLSRRGICRLGDELNQGERCLPALKRNAEQQHLVEASSISTCKMLI